MFIECKLKINGELQKRVTVGEGVIIIFFCIKT